MILTLGTTPALQRTMTFAKLSIDTVNRAVEVHEHASGKSINVARVILAMGQECVATGFLGGDSGEFCRRDMDSVGIRHDFITVIAKTRTCITLVDRQNHTATELVEESGAVALEDTRRLLDTLSNSLPDANSLVLSGTLAPGCSDDFYARCVRLASAHGVATILDAKGVEFQLALAQKPLIVKPNRTELAATLSRPIESDEQLRESMREIVSMGASWIVVTDGPRDAIVSNGREFWRLPTPRIATVNPIGSGDAFAAGIAIGLEKGLPVQEACVMGVACGAANAMTELAGHVQSDAVGQLKTLVRLEGC